MHSFKSILFILLSSLAWKVASQRPALLSDEGWKLEKSKYDVEVYGKAIEGFDAKAFKATGLIDADIFTVYNAIMDIESYSEWYPDCKLGEVLQQASDTVQVRRIVFNLPWPLDDRDAINYMISRQDGEDLWMEIVNAADFAPEQKKVVRIPKTEGYWWLRPEGSQTRLTYSAVGVAKGIPTWIVNIFLYDSPLSAINNLRAVVNRPEYATTPAWVE